MPRFVVLRHTKGSESHFDLMFEQGGVLLTFTFNRFPEVGAACERIFDHRLRYLDFEGDIGEDKGTVERMDAGAYEVLSQNENVIDIEISGGRLTGTLRLTKCGPNQWRFLR